MKLVVLAYVSNGAFISQPVDPCRRFPRAKGRSPMLGDKGTQVRQRCLKKSIGLRFIVCCHWGCEGCRMSS